MCIRDSNIGIARKMVASNSKVVSRKAQGKPKSGRVWKSKGQKKSTMINVKSLHPSWSKRSKDRSERESVKKYQKELKEAAAVEREEKRIRTEENRKRREENAKKSEIVQSITDSAKIKRMKKKQLRQIETR